MMTQRFFPPGRRFLLVQGVVYALVLLQLMACIPPAVCRTFASSSNSVFLTREMEALARPRSTCPCASPSLCKPVGNRTKVEVFVFVTQNDNYLKYDWERISTVVLFSGALKGDEIMCYAHSKGVRVSYGVTYPVDQLTNATARTSWISQQVAFVKSRFFDGINLDFESPIAAFDDARREGLNALVGQLTTAFRSNFPNPQVTFDTPYSPYSARHYDYRYIAQTLDFLLVMAYDESEVCWAGANCNFYSTLNGVEEFVAQGIKRDKLVIGFPWYGYHYPCKNVTCTNFCLVWPLCSGAQIDYSSILRILPNSTSGRLWDKTSLSPFFNYVDAKTGKPSQMWYDDPESLGKYKYRWALGNHLRGVGVWHADTLDYGDSPSAVKQREEMWRALPKVQVF